MRRCGTRQSDAGEFQIGAVVRSAVEAGLHVEGVEFPAGSYRDVGTPAELAAAIREHARLPSDPLEKRLR